MTELEKLVVTWEKHKPSGTPNERIWDGFIGVEYNGKVDVD